MKTHATTSMPSADRRIRTRPRRSSRRAGLSSVELLLALSISALLLTGMLVALNASFYAYAAAAESASAQSSSRLVMQRLLTMIRVGVLHDAYDPNDAGVTLVEPPAPPVESVGIQMLDREGQLVRIWWQGNVAYSEADVGDLWYQIDANVAQPLLERVVVQRNAADEPYVFTLTSRASAGGLLLTRATIDLTVEPGADATLALEDARGSAADVRLIGSTMPRRNVDDDD